MNTSKTKDISKKLSELKGKALRKSTNKDSSGAKVLDFLQNIGKALVYPIAILPIAGLLNRLGAFFQDASIFGDVSAEGNGLWWFGVIMQKPGDVAFGNLPTLFAIATAFSFSKDKRGEAALVGFFAFMGFSVLTTGWSGSTLMIHEDNVSTAVNDASKINWNLSWLIYGDLARTGNMVADKIVVMNDWVNNLGLNGVNAGAFGGITIGIFTAVLYNKYSNIKLPAALAFFSGRRFVPMVAVAMVIPMSFIFAIIWPWLQAGLISVGGWMGENGGLGAGFYGFFNRLLVPFGLHNATINPILWFQLPTAMYGMSSAGTEIVIDSATQNSIMQLFGDNFLEFIRNGSGNVIGFEVMGDITAFTNITNVKNAIGGADTIKTSAGTFQAGFFPIMMFGVPMMGVAAIAAADKDDRKSAAGLYGGAAAVSFLTGITEPIEFAFAFTAPILYFSHAVLSGLIGGIAVGLGLQLGFGFSAGLIDYAISIPASLSIYGNDFFSSSTILLWIIGPITSVIYFVVFYYGIQFFNVPTQGRTPYSGDKRIIRQPLAQWNYTPSTEERKKAGTKVAKVSKGSKGSEEYVAKAKKLSKILEGNIKEIDNCATRLRLKVKDSTKLDLKAIKELGYAQTVVLTKTSVQIIVGPDVELLATQLQKIMKVK